MKKIITCASIAAVGSTALQAQFLGDSQPGKVWRVAAKVRGFYDDNYTTLPAPGKRNSWGSQMVLAPGLTLGNPTTKLDLGYTYDGRFYEDRPRGTIDHTHLADLSFRHAFTERLNLDISDRFAVAQEPYLLEPGPGFSAYLRTLGDNFRNVGDISLEYPLTKRLGSHIGYSNTLWDYRHQEGQSTDGSRAALLNRMEHLGRLDLYYDLREGGKTRALLGYQYGVTKQTSDDFLFSANALRAAGLTDQQIRDGRLIPTGRIRDYNSHYGFVGVDHAFTETLNAQGRVGLRYTEWPNARQYGASSSAKADNLSPYAEATVGYSYGQGSRVSIGAKHDRNQTDVALLNLNRATTLDQESTVLFGTINQKLSPVLGLSLRGQWQDSMFNQGEADKTYDNFYGLGVELSYQLPKFWKLMETFAELGYSIDRLDSDLPGRSFSRQMLYAGFRAAL